MPDEPESTSPDATPSAPASPAPPPETPSTDWAEAYDLDSDFDPELDNPLEPAKAATTSAAKAPAETPTEPPAKPRQANGQFSKPESLIRAGRAMGFTQKQIEGWNTKQLREEIECAEIERRVERDTQRAETRQSTAPVSNEPIDWGVNEDGNPLTKEQWHPVLAKALEDIQALKAELTQARGRESAREAQTFSERCDRFFADHKDVYGDGTYESLSADDDEYQLRMDVLQAAQRDTSRRPFEQKLQRAHDRLFGRTQAVARKPRISEQEWDEAAVATPTTRNGSPEPPGTRKAVKGVNKFFRDRNISLGGDEESTLAT